MPPDASEPKWVDTKWGKGIQLDGVNDVIIIPKFDSSDTAAPTNSRTATAWLKPDRLLNRTKYVLNYVHVGLFHPSFTLGVFEGLPVGSAGKYSSLGSEEIPIGEWTHLAVTFDGNSGSTATVFRKVGPRIRGE